MVRNHRGFTLIELLTIISIIGLISTLMIVAFNKVKMTARDGKRVHDVKQIMTALDLYLNDYGVYPCEDLPPEKMCFFIIGGEQSKGEGYGSGFIELWMDYEPTMQDNWVEECIDNGGCEINWDLLDKFKKYMPLMPFNPDQLRLDENYGVLLPCDKEGSYCQEINKIIPIDFRTCILEEYIQKNNYKYIFHFMSEANNILGPAGDKLYSDKMVIYVQEMIGK